MKALIFAAGRGERMRPLTEHTPKPLLDVGGKPLIVWHIEKLATCGVAEILINTSWLAEQFPDRLGDGRRFGLRLSYSYEGPEPLETGGGIRHALPLLGDQPFIVVNGDIWTDYDFARLPAEPPGLAHVLLVPLPEYRAPGAFERAVAPLLPDAAGRHHTLAGISVVRPELLAGHPPGRFSITPLLTAAAEHGQLSVARLDAAWEDVGTPQRLRALDARLRKETKS